MKIGVIADDFTGASDIALALAEGGLKVAQFIGIPDRRSDPVLEAGVIALKSRTAPVGEAVSASLAACRWLLDQGARQIVFKVCSTFDSTPKGNIGPVLDALAQQLGTPRTLVCPAFPENGRSVYQGHLFVADRLLNESGMQDHPLTPMTDPDLRRVLARQSTMPVGHLPIAKVNAGADALREAALDQNGHLMVDAIRNQDLHTIGQAARDFPLICGGSGIAIGLPANFGARARQPVWEAIRGPGVVLSGSCSRATRGQVAAYRALAPSREVTAAEAVTAQVTIAELADWIQDQERPPLVYSSSDPETVRRAQEEHGSAQVAHAIETLFSGLAAELARRGIRRIVVAGGETSGAVVTGLAARSLWIGPRVAPGVPLLRLNQPEPLALALKSGNFGDPDFFSTALARMEVA